MGVAGRPTLAFAWLMNEPDGTGPVPLQSRAAPPARRLCLDSLGRPVRPASALRRTAVDPPSGRRPARPAPESARKGAGLRIAEGGGNLTERHLGVLQQLTGNLEPDLVRNGSVAHSTALQPTAQGAPVYREQIGNVIRRTAMVRQPRAQQPPDVVRELGSRTALQF